MLQINTHLFHAEIDGETKRLLLRFGADKLNAASGAYFGEVEGDIVFTILFVVLQTYCD